ncbi:MAG TPA: hypothetical protein VFV95_08535 [Vicinamibacterales bacterium]|nr:hypothetical protein [Vicinamibacterales bacterium]
MSTDPARLRSAIREALLESRNRDGTWPYVSGKQARLEPTCWALLALGRAGGRGPDLEVLERWQRRDHWLIDVDGAPPNQAFNGFAALTYLAHPDGRKQISLLAERIIATKAVRFPPSNLIRLDSSLQGWSWVDGTASWVEPTAWCLLFLKQYVKAGSVPAAAERISVGDRLLLDRACTDGGWNYGNSQVFGKDLWPYVPTTALALMAMQDRRSEPIVQRSLEQLQEDVASERSMSALALTIICSRVFGIPQVQVQRDLAALVERNQSRWSDNLLGLAMALYALEPGRGPDAFAL